MLLLPTDAPIAVRRLRCAAAAGALRCAVAAAYSGHIAHGRATAAPANRAPGESRTCLRCILQLHGQGPPLGFRGLDIGTPDASVFEVRGIKEIRQAIFDLRLSC